MLNQEEKPKSRLSQKAVEADVFAAAAREIKEIAAGRKEQRDREAIIENIRQNGPVKDMEAARQQISQEGNMPESRLQSSGSGVKDARQINYEVMQRAQSRGMRQPLNMYPTSQRVGNVGNVSPAKSPSMNMAAINAESKARKGGREAETEGRDSSPSRGASSLQRTKEDSNTRALKARLKEKMAASMQRNKGSLGAIDVVLLFLIFVISLASDIIDLIIDATGVGALFAPVKSMIVGIVLGMLWWVVGGEFRAANLKKVVGAFGLEAIPLVNLLPANTLVFIVNVIFMAGYGNKISDGIKKFTS